MNFGGSAVHTYGLMIALGAVALIYVAWHWAERFGIDPEKHFRGAVAIALAAMIGPKLFLVIQDFHFYSRNPGAFFTAAFWESGGIFYGGIVCGLIVMTAYVYRRRLSWLSVGDALAPGVAVGQAIGRLGCFSAGCCWGKPTSGFFGYTFHNPYAHATVGVPLGIELYPTQLLMAAGQFVIFLVLWRVARRRAFAGQVLVVYLLCYGVFRFLIVFLRFYVPSAMLFGGLLTDAQFTSICLIALAVGILASRRHARPISAA